MGLADKIYKIAKACSKDIENGIDVVDDWWIVCRRNKEEKETKIAKCISNLLSNIKNATLGDMKEPLWGSRIVETILCPFLPLSDNCILRGNTEESIGSKERRGVYGRIPDYTVSVNVDSKKQAIFVSEIKSPEYMDSLTDDSQSDFVKMINVMKDEVDLMKLDDKRTMYGLLVEGKK